MEAGRENHSDRSACASFKVNDHCFDLVPPPPPSHSFGYPIEDNPYQFTFNCPIFSLSTKLHVVNQQDKSMRKAQQLSHQEATPCHMFIVVNTLRWGGGGDFHCSQPLGGREGEEVFTEWNSQGKMAQRSNTSHKYILAAPPAYVIVSHTPSQPIATTVSHLPWPGKKKK